MAIAGKWKQETVNHAVPIGVHYDNIDKATDVNLVAVHQPDMLYAFC